MRKIIFNVTEIKSNKSVFSLEGKVDLDISPDNGVDAPLYINQLNSDKNFIENIYPERLKSLREAYEEIMELVLNKEEEYEIKFRVLGVNENKKNGNNEN